MSEQALEGYSAFKERLDEIVEAVSDEDISLDDALALYEEAVKVGLKLSDRLETDISEQEAADAGEDLGAAEGEGEEASGEVDPDFSDGFEAAGSGVSSEGLDYAAAFEG